MHCLAGDVNIASVVLQADTGNQLDVQDWNQEPMLVDVVHVVKGPEGIIPSFVGLCDVHDEVADCFGGLIYQSAIDGSYKILARRPEGEFGVIVMRAESPKNDFIDRVIHRRFKVVQRIANDESEVLKRREKLRKLDPKNIVSGLSISIDPKGVEATYCDPSNLRVEIVDVMFGPFDL